MLLCWAENAWQDYLYWQTTDKKKLKRINQLLADIQRHPFVGIGDPEPLRHKLDQLLVPPHRPRTPPDLQSGQ